MRRLLGRSNSPRIRSNNCSTGLSAGLLDTPSPMVPRLAAETEPAAGPESAVETRSRGDVPARTPLAGAGVPSTQADQPSSARAGRRSRASRASWPDRSRPMSRSPNRCSKEAGSPRSLSSSTAVSVTVWAAAPGRNGPSSTFSGGAKTPCPRIVPGSPAPPATGGSGRLARVRGPGAMTPLGRT